MNPRTSLAGALAAAALLLAVAVPNILLRRPERSQQSQISHIEVVKEGGAIRLAWSDGLKPTYTVYRSNNPRVFDSADAHVVHGNVWIDEEPSAAPVVFYRIE